VKIPESRWLTFFIAAKRPKEALAGIKNVANERRNCSGKREIASKNETL
jgi:hypothetical protein